MAHVLATAILRKREVTDLELYSAGTLNIIGSSADPNAIAAVAEWGIDLRGHRSCGIRQFDLAEHDAIVVMEPRHVYQVQGQSPLVAGRIWRLWEFLEAREPLDRIPDPIGRDLNAFRLCRDQISSSLEHWIERVSEGEL